MTNHISLNIVRAKLRTVGAAYYNMLDAHHEPRSNAMIKVVQAKSDLCSACKYIDVEFLWRAQEDVTRHTYITEESATCPLCQFILSALYGSSTEQPYDLRRMPTEITLISAQAEWEPSRRVMTVRPPNHDGENHRYIVPFSEQASDGRSITLRSVHGNSVDFATLRSWITLCREHHANSCAHQNFRNEHSILDTPGFKFIDCVTRQIVRTPLPNISYVALSYVWGTTLGLHNTGIVPQYGEAGLLPERLPQTIEDAIVATVRLGFQYLWVDKYCIDQAQPQNVQAQVLMMDLIYHAASATIIAAAGHDSTYGLPGVRPEPRSLQNALVMGGTVWTSILPDLKTPVRESSWFTRGWTYQEAFFSRRRFMFTHEQVYFECDGFSSCEFIDGDIGEIPSSPPISGRCEVLRESGYYTFDAHVMFYSRRKLSYPSDVLNAMRGLFRYFSISTEPWQQFWGLPVTLSSCFDPALYSELNAQNQVAAIISYGLCWMAATGTQHRTEQRQGFPSWSWAGWIAPVSWPLLIAPASQKLWSNSNWPQQISVLRKDGSKLILTEELAAKFLLNSDEASLYTYNLSLVAEVVDLTFTYLRNGLVIPIYSATSAISNYAVKVTYSIRDDDQAQSLYAFFWPLIITPHVDPHDPLHMALCKNIFQCVVLENSWGLVVWEKDGLFERVGVINLYGVNVMPHEIEPQRQPYLRDYFPSTTREIVLS